MLASDAHLETHFELKNLSPTYIVVTYEIWVFFEGAKKEVFSSILKKAL